MVAIYTLTKIFSGALTPVPPPPPSPHFYTTMRLSIAQTSKGTHISALFHALTCIFTSISRIFQQIKGHWVAVTIELRSS